MRYYKRLESKGVQPQLLVLDPSPYKRYPVLARELPSRVARRPIQLTEESFLKAQEDWKLFSWRATYGLEHGSSAADELEELIRLQQRIIRLERKYGFSYTVEEALIVEVGPRLYQLNASEYRLHTEE